MPFLLAVLVILSLKIGLLVGALYQNWTIAKQLHSPIILCPLTPKRSPWKYVQSVLPSNLPYYVQRLLPFTRLVRDNWMFHEKYSICEDYGEVFALVTPGGVEVFIANAEVARQVLTRGRDFPKQIELMGMDEPNDVRKQTVLNLMIGKMNVFGKILATVDGTDWKRHRRCIAAAFSDKVHENVWSFSCTKAARGLANLSSQETSTSMRSEMGHLSFSVLMQACMGIKDSNVSKDNKETNRKNELDIDTAERDLTRLLRIMSIRRPPTLPTLRMPSFLRQRKPKANPFEDSLQGLNVFFTNLIEDCKAHPQPGQNVLSSIIYSRDTELVSDDEIKGNLFLLMFAGHETTANTLLYIIYLLAIFPEWQKWATDELDQILSDIPQHVTPTLQEISPRLTRFKAIMYETLRLYGPVPNLLRKTLPDQPQTVSISQQSDIFIPGNIKLNILTLALHTSPNHWGPDAREWNPSRWINTTKCSAREEIDQRKLASLSAWAEGPRACPGKTFSQLEIVAVLMTLFRQTRVQLDAQGMSVDQARIEALQAVEQSRVRLTLQMEHPDLVRLRWFSR